MAEQRAWTDDVRRPAAGAGEGRGGCTVRGLGLRGARVQAGRADGRRADVQVDGPNRAILARIMQNRPPWPESINRKTSITTYK